MNWPYALRTSALFAREWLGRPASVGAVCPSSPQLARQIARQVPAGNGVVIELGGGTGAVTQALLDNGVTPERLIVVERSAAFVEHLRNRFPSITVIHGDAMRLKHVLPRDLRVDAIVSCLPLRSLPRRETAAIVEQWHHVLAEHGVVIQFTYGLRRRPAHTAHDSDFVICSSRIVWANVPPARIVTARKRAQHAAATRSATGWQDRAKTSAPAGE